MTDVPNPLEGKLNDTLAIANVVFGDDMIEVDFFDPRRQADGVMEFTKIVIQRSKLLNQIEEIEELLRDLVDEALVLRRK